MWKVALKGIVARKGRLFLTSLAVILGTSFLSGTQIFSDTLNRTFDTLFAEVFADVNAYVRSSNVIETDFGAEERTLLPASIAEDVAKVEGVQSAIPQVQAYARIIGKDGEAIGSEGNGPPTFGAVMTENDVFWELLDGRAPANDTEVALDESSADAANYVVGDTVRISAKAGTRDFKLVGIAKYGGVSSPGGATFALFDLQTATEFLGTPGFIDAVLVVGDGSLSDRELADKITASLSSYKEIETLTGDEITKETQDQIGAVLDFFSIFLRIFAFIALGVATFVIYNVFSITAAQRMRESALLRAIGASRKQVTRALLIESAAVGLIGSAFGIVAGIGLSRGLKAMLQAFGVDLPSRGLVITGSAIVTTLVVGMIVTLIAGVFPARSAGKVPPIAAMRDSVSEVVTSRKSRFVFTVLCFVIGGASVIAVFAGAAAGILGLGVVAIFMGVLAIGPVTARPLAMLIGAPIQRLRGVTGTMACENAARNPKRTARTAAPVLIGVALVTAVTVLAASLRTEIRNLIGEQFKGDYAISVQTQGFGGLSPTLVDEVAKLSSVEQATSIGFATVKIADKGRFASVINPVTAAGLIDLEMIKGAQADLDADGVLVSEGQSEKLAVGIGDTVEAMLTDGSELELTVRGIFDNGTFTTGGFVVNRELFADRPTSQFDFAIYIVKKDGVSDESARAELGALVEQSGVGKLASRSEYIDDQAGQVNQLLGLVYGLLALSVIIAVVGIVITLLLSVFERRRELGLLRAVGMSRSQVRSSIRWESVITSLIGAVSGVILGIALGWVIVRALDDEGLKSYTLPIGGTIGILILSFMIGVIAAIYPARRATRMNVLESLSAS
jgi:putative ABC transport system permease protein